MLLVVALSAALGGGTSFLQTFPDALRPFANPASGWTLLAALAVGVFDTGTVPSAVAGAASFAAPGGGPPDRVDAAWVLD